MLLGFGNLDNKLGVTGGGSFLPMKLFLVSMAAWLPPTALAQVLG